jgi:sulfite oxidase
VSHCTVRIAHHGFDVMRAELRPRDALTRRRFLAGGAALATAAAIGCRPGRGPAAPARASGLIVRSDDPYCAETPLEALTQGWITPTSLFFVLDHGAVPTIDADAWSVELAGDVARPRRWTLAELQQLPSVRIPATLVCAGNRRREHHALRPVRDRVLWGAGAVGTAWWTGARLDELLDLAGIGAGAAHVWFEGLDDGDRGLFGGSVPIARVRDRNQPPVLIAYAMNDAPLPRLHGFPARAVVPGFIGARSVKWLRRIVVSDRPSPNPYFQISHRLDDRPITEFPVNAAIGAVEAREGDDVRVLGYALPGGAAAEVARVEVSIDGGAWMPAARGIAAPGCWTLWSIDVPRAPFDLAVRAVDSRGAKQPELPPWNKGGYLYNGWPRARIGGAR